jgi:phenylacetate-coenzyme A ligase PaaK-like adenylate-forming protein
MKPHQKTPLDNWIAEKIGLPEEAVLTPETLARYQVCKLNATIAFAFCNSPFYQRHFGGRMPLALERGQDLARLPFTTADDLRRDPDQFLCVSQDAVARVVTLNTSGTTQSPKRIFFTDADLELTIDFFHRGMSTLVCPGQRVLVLLPGDRPASVGDLLKRALPRMDVQAFIHGPVAHVAAAVEDIRHNKIDCLVGLPAQVNALAHSGQAGEIPAGQIKSVLLTADYVPRSIVASLEKRWRCRVYQHYGMTESGLGGGVECDLRNGYHLREADLFYEIVDPEEGRPLPPGEVGEVVFTTLTRRGMPLIRYRTGDLAAFKTAACPCGSTLRRMRPVQRRIDSGIALGDLAVLHLPDLDEAIFSVDGVMDYQAKVISDGRGARLKLRVVTDAPREADIAATVRAAALSVPSIAKAATAKALQLEKIALGPLITADNSAIKRRIIDGRKEAAP